MMARERGVKREIRVMGIDDGPFNPREGGKCPLVGAIYRGSDTLEGVESTWIEVDGMDATAKIVGMVMGSKHRGQLRAIMLNGITFAGFNVADLHRISEETALPLIAIVEREPRLDQIGKALKNLSNYRRRWQMVKRAGRPVPLIVPPRRRPLYAHAVNISLQRAREMIERTRNRSAIPEPLRVAHLISSAFQVREEEGEAIRKS
jgi:endonuclease V-like protein UPF0215 family